MTVAEWRAVVYQHRGLPASVKVLLLFLADHMADDLTVSMPQSELASGLGMFRQNVTRVVSRACDNGMLLVVEPARGRMPATYRANRRGINVMPQQTNQPDASSLRRGITPHASTDLGGSQQTNQPDASSLRRGITGDASSCDESISSQLPLESSPPAHPQLLTHGQVLVDDTSPAVSRRVGGPGGGIERPDVEALCTHLADRIEGNGSKRPTINQRWRDAARRLLDIDGRPLDEAHRLIDWAHDDDFWAGNILGMWKFRKQYDQLRLKCHASRRRPQGFTAADLQDTFAAAAAHDQAYGL